MALINDKQLRDEVIYDLIDEQGYSREDAEQWADNNVENILDDMWYAYSQYIAEYTDSKGL